MFRLLLLLLLQQVGVPFSYTRTHAIFDYLFEYGKKYYENLTDGERRSRELKTACTAAGKPVVVVVVVVPYENIK